MKKQRRGNKTNQPTCERVRELFDYNAESGQLIRKVSIRAGKGGRGRLMCCAGAAAGSVNKCSGYSDICVDGYKTLVHRIIWLWVHGYLPEFDIDHVDGDRQNNRLINLREVSRSCNTINTGLRITNTSGVKGISRNVRDGLWHAYIGVCGRRINLGQHKNFEEAVAHRLAAEQCLGWTACSSISTAYLYLREGRL